VQELRIARTKAGMTLMELEAASGVGASTISKIERGVTQPQAITLHKLADALGVEVTELYPKGRAPSPEPAPLNGPKDERRIFIDYDTCRAALEDFCDHWQPALSGKRRLEYQGFQDFKASAASLSRLTRELMGAEMTELGQPYDEEGDPVFYTERSEFGPAIVRFQDIAIRMDRIGKELFGEDLTSDPEMGQLINIFPKAS
jgi:transcriptional regulator with XRE-family HTH domain